MFKFLKDKLKKSIEKFSKDVDEEAKTEEVEKGFFKKIFKKDEDVFEELEKEESKEVDEEIKEILNEDSDSEVIKEEKKEIKKVLEDLKEEAKIEQTLKVEESIPKDNEEIDIEKIEEELKSKNELTEDNIDVKAVERELKKEEEIAQKEIVPEEIHQEIKPSNKPLEEEEEQKKEGIFAKIKKTIVTKTLSVDKFNDLFFDLEVTLLENNVAIEVIEKIKSDLRRELVNKPVPRNAIPLTILNTLKSSINELFDIKSIDILSKIKDKKPTIISFVGINGSGKTTTIAKMASLFKKNGFKVVIAAADTFRAASIEQIQVHADKLGMKLIKHDYGSDPAAVAYDAVNYAKAKGIDVVLIDTAGRLHNNKNLMDEIKKIMRVAKPDFNIFIGESITGNDCVEQAKQFNEAVGIDGIVLSKADIDEKGGASISISHVTKKPIMFLGVGQEYDDLKIFDKEEIIKSLGF